MLGELKLLSEAVTVCSTSSWLVHTTVVPAATVRSAGMKLKFSTLIEGPSLAAAGRGGFAGGSVASAAGGTGDGSAAAALTVTAAGVGVHALSATMAINAGAASHRGPHRAGMKFTLSDKPTRAVRIDSMYA